LLIAGAYPYTRGVRPLGVVAVTATLLPLSACGSSSAPAASAPAAPANPCAAAAPAPPSRLPGGPLRTILRVPANVRGKPAPLVLALHFASGTGAQMEQLTRLTPEARRSGFVVAYPTATSGGFWAGANEIDAVTSTIQAIERVACIDTRRIYATGMSNGGGMASVLACRLSERIAGVVLFAPALGPIGDCKPSRPVPVLEVHGTADPIVSYSQIPRYLATWARLDGCAPGPRSSKLRPALTLRRWHGCRGGSVVEHLRLAAGRHIELFGELRAAGVDPARTAWRFLAPHRAPR
jgi:polyhydroxybutyrate depolymerase